MKNAQFWRRYLAEKQKDSAPAIRLMEVCGTHTHVIARHGLRKLLPSNVTLISGPGCPVCVSGAGFIEKIRILLRKSITVALFGDLLRIPGAEGTLAGESHLRIVYSPSDALTFALENPHLDVVFAAVGFAPTLSAAAALMAEITNKDCDNFSLLTDFKEIRPVLDSLCGSCCLSGLILPGHVASVTGVEHFSYLSVPGVVAGFDPENILHSISQLLDAVSEGKKDHLSNNYPQAVREKGNQEALRLIENYFTLSSSVWRGLGKIPQSGRVLKDVFAKYDAAKRYSLEDIAVEENPACRCGEILSGVCAPEECPLFGKGCSPENPVGACMASGEGSCAAAFIYGRRQ